MASIRSGTITLGLVAIPVRLYVATHSEQLSFNLLHQDCGARIRQQLYCPPCARVVERRELVKGYAVAKDRYVTLTDAELQALAAAASPAIEIQEFVPLACVDPLYFADGHYLGPDTGGEKACALLATAMRDRGRVALAQYVSHGKEHLALLRPFDRGLVLHALYYADEVRPFDGIGIGDDVELRGKELTLAAQLIDQLSTEEFHPEVYQDSYRARVQAVVEQKVAGQDVTIVAAEPVRAPIIDLMAALTASLSRRGGQRPTRAGVPAERERVGRRRPLAAGAPAAGASPRQRTRGRK